MKIIARGTSFSSTADAKKLSELHQAQLLLALEAHFGKKTSFAKAFPREEPCTVERHEIADDAGVVLFDFWVVDADGGSIFRRDTTENAGVEMIQFDFEVIEGASDAQALDDLALALSRAERLPDPDAPLTFVEGKLGWKSVRRIDGFNRADAVPKTPREWDRLLAWPNIYVTEAFAEKHSAALTRANWVTVVRYCELSEPFIRKHLGALELNEVVFNQALSDDFLREFADELDWSRASGRQTLSPAILRDFGERIDWKAWSAQPSVDDAMLEAFADKTHWPSVDCTNRGEAFLRRHADALPWSGIRGVSANRLPLSSEFLRDFGERLNWAEWSRYGAISDAQLEEFSGRIHWASFSQNGHITDAQIRKYADRIDWALLLTWGRSISEELLREHAEHVDDALWAKLIRLKKLPSAYAKEVSARLRRAEKQKPV